MYKETVVQMMRSEYVFLSEGPKCRRYGYLSVHETQQKI